MTRALCGSGGAQERRHTPHGDLPPDSARRPQPASERFCASSTRMQLAVSARGPPVGSRSVACELPAEAERRSVLVRQGGRSRRIRFDPPFGRSKRALQPVRDRLLRCVTSRARAAHQHRRWPRTQPWPAATCTALPVPWHRTPATRCAAPTPRSPSCPVQCS